MTGIVWDLEWRIALRRRRVLVFNVTIPLLLVAPLALGGAPAHHAAAVEAVLFVLFGTFGSAIPLVRDTRAGLLRRVALTGLPARRWIVERTLAHALLDTLELLPALGIVIAGAALAGADAGATVLATLPLVLAFTLVTTNALGAWIGALAGSIAEGALFCAVVALLLLHGGGVFRTPEPGSAAAAVERLIPFRYLHETLLAAFGAPTGPGAALGPVDRVTGAAVGAAVALGACAALAVPIRRRLVDNRSRDG